MLARSSRALYDRRRPTMTVYVVQNLSVGWMGWNTCAKPSTPVAVSDGNTVK